MNVTLARCLCRFYITTRIKHSSIEFVPPQGLLRSWCSSQCKRRTCLRSCLMVCMLIAVQSMIVWDTPPSSWSPNCSNWWVSSHSWWYLLKHEARVEREVCWGSRCSSQCLPTLISVYAFIFLDCGINLHVIYIQFSLNEICIVASDDNLSLSGSCPLLLSLLCLSCLTYNSWFDLLRFALIC